MGKEIIGLLSVMVLFLAACQQLPQEPATGVIPPKQTEEGRAVFAITDAAADMKAVTSIKITIDEVSVHSAAEGWATVLSAQKTYDLLKLKAEGSQELLADISLKPGIYEQVRLHISKVVVMDASGEHEAKLPSGELKILGNLVIDASSTSTATFDFMADESLHLTGNGEYILAPVVELETKEKADVEVKSDNKVEIKLGKTITKTKVGMDIDGNVGVGLKIGLNEVLSIEGGKIKIGALVSEQAKSSSSASGSSASSAGSSTSAGVSTGGGYY
ncbi:DUF4382 domain-containing protein [Candidatus Woesearchaeota archaeon]|nr:DUF4382 domain-containing protein [Candidatus Woesearchaeota archaeon]